MDNFNYYKQFAQVLRGSDAASMKPFLRAENSLSRLNIHQSNFRITTTKAMQGTYRAVSRLVGDEYFFALMDKFLQDHPPKSSSLAHYGGAFPDFLRHFAPVQNELPWLAPIAQLDWAWFQAYGVLNTPALSAKALQHISPELLPTRAPGLHPSVALFRFSVPAYSIWRTNIEDETIQKVDLKQGGEWACVWRDAQTVRSTVLTQAEYAFLDAIGGKRSLAEAWTDAQRYKADFNLTSYFAKWLNDGIFDGEEHD